VREHAAGSAMVTARPLATHARPISLERHDLVALVAHEVDHSIVALPDPILVLARQLLTTGRSRVCRQAFDPTNNPPAVFLGVRFQFLTADGLIRSL